MAPQAEEINRAVAQRVIRAREEAGLQKNELAERLGLSKSGYTSYEKFDAPFTVEQLFRLQRILERPVAYFLGLSSDITLDEEQLLTAYRSIPPPAAAGALMEHCLRCIPIIRPPNGMPSGCSCSSMMAAPAVIAAAACRAASFKCTTSAT